ncbi:hypothetical protein C8Q70DRAFT_584404 [Cubamyces menziesii]|nr:hypothetical protein C8Q70DRAFT_584404 [Cubamyces menziesii]
MNVTQPTTGLTMACMRARVRSTGHRRRIVWVQLCPRVHSALIPIIVLPIEGDHSAHAVHLAGHLDVTCDLFEVRHGEGVGPIFSTGQKPSGTVAAVCLSRVSRRPSFEGRLASRRRKAC